MNTTSAVMFLLLVCYASSARGQTLEWARQLGSSSEEQSFSVSADGLGSVYISGYTEGSLDGINAGSKDAFVAKYDAAGAHEWTRQLGTRGDRDTSSDVSADGLGNVYISGLTDGSLGGPNAGGGDVFISKYDSSGMLEWTRQLGTSDWDWSGGVSADGLGNVYISGQTRGSLGGPNAGGGWDAFVAKYDAAGALEWTRQLGTSDADNSNGVSADGLGSVYLSGWTDEADRDAFISKYDASGTLQWTNQLGTSGVDRSNGVSADGLGSVYITGNTNGSLDGPFLGGRSDVFVAKFSTGLSCDFDSNLTCNIVDVNRLVGEIVAGTNDSALDVTADGAVNDLDLTEWLAEAATENGFADPYLLGDANLDGTVNAADLNALGQNWLGGPNTWQFGDFNADGIVNASDLNKIGRNWLTELPSAASLSSAVPEPAAATLAAFILAVVTCLRRRTLGIRAVTCLTMDEPMREMRR